MPSPRVSAAALEPVSPPAPNAQLCVTLLEQSGKSGPITIVSSMLGTAHREYGRKVRGRIGIYGCAHLSSPGKSKKEVGQGGPKVGQDLSGVAFGVLPDAEEHVDAFCFDDFDLGEKSLESSSQAEPSDSHAQQRDARRDLAKRMSIDLHSMESVFMQRKNMAN